MWPIVRLTASALASQFDFAFDEIEDIRLAVTELCSSCAFDSEADATSECRFGISDNQFEMSCTVSPVSGGDNVAGDEDHPLIGILELSLQILRATVDEFSIPPAENRTRTGYLRKERVPVALR